MKLNARFIEHLRRAGILGVYVEDQFSQGIDAEPVITAQTRGKATRALADLHEEARQAVAARRTLDPEATDELSDVVDQILLEIEESDGKAVVLADLCAADAYHLQHPIDVTALGLLIGRRLIIEHGWLDYKGERQDDRHEERLFRLGMGLLLSDIGKFAVPESILNKPGKLSEEEWEIVQTHPKAGVKLVRDTGAWCPLVQACVLRHHERWDGTGYPEGKSGAEIHEMARIAAVADVYDAITSERVFAPAKPAHVGLPGDPRRRRDAVRPDDHRPFLPPDRAVPARRRSRPRRRPPRGRRERVRARPRPPRGAGYQRRRALPADISLTADPSIQIAGWNPIPAAGAAQAA